MIGPGDVAPDFTLTDQRGEDVCLADLRGVPVVVWFIPSTMVQMAPPCCDHIAGAFGHEVLARGLKVIGISFDTPRQMEEFASRSLATFPLCSDTDKTVGEAYGVRRGEGHDWDCFPLKRAFLVGADGVVVKRYDNIDPDFFVPEVAEDVAALQGAAV